MDFVFERHDAPIFGRMHDQRIASVERRPFAPGALKMTPQILNTIGIALSRLGAVLIFIWTPAC